MSQICPTITACSPEEYAAQIERIEKFASRVQIDITDGIFAQPATVNLNQVYAPESWQTDLHLMIQKPLAWLEAAIALSPNLVIFHAEADCDILALAEHLKKFNIKTGIALLPETSVTSVSDFLPKLDHVLIFAGKLGSQGGRADLAQLDKVAEIREIVPKIEIGWDGGVNLKNVAEIFSAGIDVINVGSAIQGAEDPAKIYDNLQKIARLD